MSATTAFLPLRAVRRVLGRVERALRPAPPVAPAHALAPPDAPTPSPDEDAADADATTTRELLLPERTDEPPAARASRQAQDYLERRRRKLNDQLDGR